MRTTPERQVSGTQRAQEQRASSPRYSQVYALTKGFTAALFPSKPHIPKVRAAVGQRLINPAQYRMAAALASYAGSWMGKNCQVRGYVAAGSFGLHRERNRKITGGRLRSTRGLLVCIGL
jgi:hypothetical protein